MITFALSSRNDSNLPDCFLDEHGSVILLLLQLDGHGDTIREVGTLSDEIRGTSEIGDLIDSLFGCLPSDTLSDLGIHFDRVVVVSSLSKTGSPLLVLHFKIDIFLRKMRGEYDYKNYNSQ